MRTPMSTFQQPSSRRCGEGAWMWSRFKIAASNSTVLAQALREERVLLTNDQDFLRLAASLAQLGETFAPIFFWPQQRRTIGEIVRSIIREATLSDYEAARSRVFYL
jgi:hypothetical protein